MCGFSWQGISNMAAEQIVGRVCACGCGASLDGMHRSAKWFPACRDRIVRERKKESHRKRSLESRRANRSRSLERLQLQRGSLTHGAWRVIERHEPVKNRRQYVCLVCFGMPWARRPDRLSEGRPGFEKPVVDDTGLCRGCGEAWEPEPAPEPMSLLSSSAGTAVRHGQLHGTDVCHGRGKYERKKKP